MPEQLWTPPQATTLPRAVLPEGDLTLADGRTLRFFGSFHTPPPEKQHCKRWVAQKRLAVIASMDPTPHGKLLHVSVSYPNRLPSWKDVRMVRDVFFPASIDAMMLLPREQDYVNAHPFCFHLWQTPMGWGIQ